MTNDEMQRAMAFIVEQQAQITANFQRAEEERIHDKPRLARLEDSFQRLVALCEITDARLDTTDAKLNATDARLDRTDARLDRVEANESALEANMIRLAEAQAHADERLSALIDIVREDRNGKSQAP